MGVRPEDAEDLIVAAEQISCSVCGARLTTELITYAHTTGEHVYIITGVPAEVCPQCGEQYLAPETVDAIQDLIERGEAGETREVPVYHLRPVTAP